MSLADRRDGLLCARSSLSTLALACADGQWRWPAAARVPFDGASDDAGASLHEAMQIRLYEALLKEELLPMVDAAVHDLSMQRTPGTFLYDCAQAASGAPPGAASSGMLDDLRRRNQELSKQVAALGGRSAKLKDKAAEAKELSELATAQEQMRKLMAENALLRSAAAQNSSKLHAVSRAHGHGAAAKSSACLLS